MPAPTVENLCNVLAKHKLLASEVIRAQRVRWRAEAGPRADDVAAFRQWLVQQGSLTAFQMEMLDRGFADFLHFGEYNLLERIGSGRMAGVYKAMHPLGQVVAIKVLPPSKAKNPQTLGRFVREARLAVRLDHDNVVRAFQHAQTREGMHYIVMEFLDGETLEEVLQRRSKLPPDETARILAQALAGLEHLNDRNLVHRDIKPGNLMLVPGPGANREKSTSGCTVKVLDIGLGRALFDEGGPNEEAGDLTSDGALLGTLNYMAPEQARNAHAADVRADLYSLGCVAYEMLTGKPPFTDANFVRLMRMHAEDKPRPLAEQVPGMPPGLERVIDRLLAKDPSLRYGTPGQALKDLKAQVKEAVTELKFAQPLPEYVQWLKAQEAPPTNGAPIPPPALPCAAPLSPLATATPLTAPLPAGAHPPTLFRWGKREWFAAGIGAGAMGVLVLLVILVRKIIG